jgi:hypothetical protein
MDVRRCTQGCFHIHEISVVSRTLLPKTKRFDPRSLANGQLLQQWTPYLCQELLDAVGIRPLDGLEQLINPGGCFSRENQEMHVFRHEDKGYQEISVALHGTINAVTEHGTPCLIGQQRETPETGECQFMEMTGFVQMLNSFAKHAS